jgi:hypothetical protein
MILGEGIRSKERHKRSLDSHTQEARALPIEQYQHKHPTKVDLLWLATRTALDETNSAHHARPTQTLKRQLPRH